MYTIYAKVGDKKVCIHDSTVSNADVKAIEPVLTLEDSNAGSLTFKVASNNQAYGDITVYDSIASGFDEIVSSSLTTSDFTISDISSDGTEDSSTLTCLRTPTAINMDADATTIAISATIAPGHVELVDSTYEFEQGYSVIREPITDDQVFILLYEPTNWSTNWTDYYTKNEQNQYVSVTGETAPEFEPDKYYKRYSVIHSTALPRIILRANDAQMFMKAAATFASASTKYALLFSKPSDWDTNWTDYYVYSGGEYTHVTGETAPEFTTGTYYKLIPSITGFSDITSDFTLGEIYGMNDTARTSRYVSTKKRYSNVNLTNSADYTCIIVDPANARHAFQVRYYGYRESGAVAYESGWVDADGTHPLRVSAQSIMYYRLQIRRKDDAAITMDQISHIYAVNPVNIQWRLSYFGDLGSTHIGDSDWFDLSNQYEGLVVTPNTVYGYKVEVRYNTLDDIAPSDISQMTMENVGTAMWKIACYNASDTFLGISDWFRANDSVSLSSWPSAKKFKIVVKDKIIGEGENEHDYVMSSAILTATAKQNKVIITNVQREIDILARMQSKVTVYRKELVKDPITLIESYKEFEIWEGRVLTEDKDFYNNRSIYCEGELAYLNDTCQPQREYSNCTLRQYLEGILSYHNSRVSIDKQFQVGQIWVSDDTSKTRFTQYQKTMEVLNNLVEEYGGHIKIRKTDGYRYIDWFSDYGQDNNPEQIIDFGKNLLDYSANWDMTELCTVVLPTGHVVKEAKKAYVGDALPLNGGAGPTPCQILTKDSSGRVYVQSNPKLAGYYTAVAKVEPEKNYYFSGRLHGGLVAYTIKSNEDGSGDYFDGGTKTAGSENQVGFVDFVDQKITIPAGAHSVVMCSFGDAIPMALKEEIPETEGLDEYLTVEECADDVDQTTGYTWHQKGSLYVVNQEAVNTYGWIERQLAKDDIEDKDVLYQTAKLYLQEGQFDQMTLEVTAVDMNLLGANTDYIDLLDEVRVISKPHGVDRYFPVTKIEIPLDNPAEQKFTLGTKTEQTLTSVNNSVNNELFSKIAGMPSMNETLRSAKANSAELINNALNGYVSIVSNPETGKPMELVISDREDYTSSDAHVWRWNHNGLGYSSNGYQFNSDNTRVALTADGSIVADFITAGTLTGINIQGCTIIAGGIGDQAGKVYVLSSGTDYAVELDNGAISFGHYNTSNNPPFTKFADIRGNISYQGSYTNGIRIMAPVLALDTDALWVSESSAGGNPGTGYNGKFQVKDNNGQNVELVFTRGILLSKTP